MTLMHRLLWIAIVCTATLPWAAVAEEEENSAVQVLTDASFEDVVGQNKHVFVEFYAPWCGHCKRLAPHWETLAEAFKDEPSVVIAKVDATVEKEMPKKYKVSGYPTLLFFPAGSSEPIPYQGARTPEALVDFVNEQAGTARSVEGGVNPEFGLLAELTAALDEVKCTAADGAQACFDQLAAAVDKATQDAGGAFSDFSAKLGKFYKNALDKASAKALFIKSELERLAALEKDPNVKPDARRYVTARKNILTDLKRAITEKLPNYLSAAKEEL